MMTDDDGQAVEGEIVGPEGDGQWLPVPAAQVILGIPQKTLYRRAERGKIPSRKNADGRIEVWVSNAPPQEQRLSPIVSVNTVDVRELLAPLAQALSDSQREALTATERAVNAERDLQSAQAQIDALQARLSRVRPGRIDAIRSWWHFWILGETGDSQ